MLANFKKQSLIFYTITSMVLAPLPTVEARSVPVRPHAETAIGHADSISKAHSDNELIDEILQSLGKLMGRLLRLNQQLTAMERLPMVRFVNKPQPSLKISEGMDRSVQYLNAANQFFEEAAQAVAEYQKMRTAFIQLLGVVDPGPVPGNLFRALLSMVDCSLLMSGNPFLGPVAGQLQMLVIPLVNRLGEVPRVIDLQLIKLLQSGLISTERFWQVRGAIFYTERNRQDFSVNLEGVAAVLREILEKPALDQKSQQAQSGSEQLLQLIEQDRQLFEDIAALRPRTSQARRTLFARGFSSKEAFMFNLGEMGRASKDLAKEFGHQQFVSGLNFVLAKLLADSTLTLFGWSPHALPNFAKEISTLHGLWLMGSNLVSFGAFHTAAEWWLHSDPAILRLISGGRPLGKILYASHLQWESMLSKSRAIVRQAGVKAAFAEEMRMIFTRAGAVRVPTSDLRQRFGAKMFEGRRMLGTMMGEMAHKGVSLFGAMAATNVLFGFACHPQGGDIGILQAAGLHDEADRLWWKIYFEEMVMSPRFWVTTVADTAMFALGELVAGLTIGLVAVPFLGPFLGGVVVLGTVIGFHHYLKEKYWNPNEIRARMRDTINNYQELYRVEAGRLLNGEALASLDEKMVAMLGELEERANRELAERKLVSSSDQVVITSLPGAMRAALLRDFFVGEVQMGFRKMRQMAAIVRNDASEVNGGRLMETAAFMKLMRGYDLAQAFQERLVLGQIREVGERGENLDGAIGYKRELEKVLKEMPASRDLVLTLAKLRTLSAALNYAYDSYRTQFYAPILEAQVKWHEANDNLNREWNLIVAQLDFLLGQPKNLFRALEYVWRGGRTDGTYADGNRLVRVLQGDLPWDDAGEIPKQAYQTMKDALNQGSLFQIRANDVKKYDELWKKIREGSATPAEIEPITQAAAAIRVYLLQVVPRVMFPKIEAARAEYFKVVAPQLASIDKIEADYAASYTEMHNEDKRLMEEITASDICLAFYAQSKSKENPCVQDTYFGPSGTFVQENASKLAERSDGVAANYALELGKDPATTPANLVVANMSFYWDLIWNRVQPQIGQLPESSRGLMEAFLEIARANLHLRFRRALEEEILFNRTKMTVTLGTDQTTSGIQYVEEQNPAALKALPDQLILDRLLRVDPKKSSPYFWGGQEE